MCVCFTTIRLLVLSTFSLDARTQPPTSFSVLAAAAVVGTPQAPQASSTPTAIPTVVISPTSSALPTSTTTATPAPTDDPSHTPTASETPSPALVTATALPGGGESTSTPTPSLTPALALATAFPTLTPDVVVTVPLISTRVPHRTPISFPRSAPILFDHVDGQVIVQFVSGLEAMPLTIALLLDQDLVSVQPALPALQIWLLEVPAGEEGDYIALLRLDPQITYAEANYVAKAFESPNDALWDQQGNLRSIQLPEAWEITAGSPSAVIAVIDTGVDIKHPDLATKIWRNVDEEAENGEDDDHNGYVDDVVGWNLVGQSADVTDKNGHGTQVAGIAAAHTDNGLGIAGVAWESPIMVLKALDVEGVGSYLHVAQSLVYAADNGARVINLSLGGPADSLLLHQAVDYASVRGCTIVAAAGTDDDRRISYPAALPGVIAVGADESVVSAESQTDLVAPGLSVPATYPGGSYWSLTGDSAAAAQVSGVAALLLDIKPDASPSHIRSVMISSATNESSRGQGSGSAKGLVQAYNAIMAISGEGGARPGATPISTVELSIRPTATPVLAVTPTYDPMRAPVEYLWGTAQECGFPMLYPENSIDLAFNDLAAACAGDFAEGAGQAWTFTAFQDTELPVIPGVTLEVRMAMQGYQNDLVELQLYDGENWHGVDTFQSTNRPPDVLETLSYPVSTFLTDPSELDASQLRLIGADIVGPADSLTIQIDGVRLVVNDPFVTPTPLPPIPTPTAPAPAPTSVPEVGDPHADHAATTDSCAGCHRSHTAQAIVLRSGVSEETVCFRCHAADGIGTNVEPAFRGVANTATAFFKHDVGATIGIHEPGQSAPEDYGDETRHIECEDCHEPHSSARGSTAAPILQYEANFASGVDPVWTGAGGASSYSWLPAAEREYQVCFKCHSGFTTLPTYLPDGWDGRQIVADGLRKVSSGDPIQVSDSRDLAREFNPYSTSFHPVVALGRNRSIAPESFVDGWSHESMVYCGDCHNNANAIIEGEGPHGSPLLHLLDGTSNYQTAAPDSMSAAAYTGGELCFKCHRYETYVTGSDPPSNTNFRRVASNLHKRHANDGSCYLCHDSHGSEQLHLLNLDVSVLSEDTYLLPGYNGMGTNSQSFWQISPDRSEKSCWMVCHRKDHSRRSYPNYSD